MRSSKNKNPCFDCLASEKENEEVCKTIRAMLNKSNSVQVEMKDPGSIGTLTIGDCTYNVYLGNTTLNKLRCLPDKDMAIVKKWAGNNGNYNNIFRKFIPEMAKEEKAAKKAKKAQKAEK